MSKFKYVIWNNYSLKSLKNAERYKSRLENKGYKLVHESIGCLTYKEVKQ